MGIAVLAILKCRGQLTGFAPGDLSYVFCHT